MSASIRAVEAVKGVVPESLHAKVEAAAERVPSRARIKAANEAARHHVPESFAVVAQAPDQDKLVRAIEQGEAVLQNRRTSGGRNIAVGGGYRDTEFSRAFFADKEARA